MKRSLVIAAALLLSACGPDARLIVHKDGATDLQARADYRACAAGADKVGWGQPTDYSRVNRAKACMMEKGWDISYADVGAPRPKDLNGNPMWPGTQVVP